MRRLRIVRPCPEVPAALRDAVESTGSGHCDACGETVVDLTGPDAEERLARRVGPTCGRILVAAALVATAACSSSADSAPLPAAPVATTSTADAGPTLDDDQIYYGMVDIDDTVATPPPTVQRPAPERSR